MRKSQVFLCVLSLLAACASTPPQSVEPQGETPFHHAVSEPVSELKEPTFAITSIEILQADLINTKFKLSLKIDNPNAFPITLSSFRYELYGDGRLWTDGVEKDLGAIPAQGDAETSFKFEMNFMGMKRRLLDDIIAMRDVRYRITGSMEMETAIQSLPSFHLPFDLSGNSPVIQ